MERDIVLKKSELDRLRVLHMVLDRKMTQVAAARMMGISVRHTKRLVKRIKTHGDQSIAHANRGKPSPRFESAKRTRGR